MYNVTLHYDDELQGWPCELLKDVRVEVLNLRRREDDSWAPPHSWSAQREHSRVVWRADNPPPTQVIVQIKIRPWLLRDLGGLLGGLAGVAALLGVLMGALRDECPAAPCDCDALAQELDAGNAQRSELRADVTAAKDATQVCTKRLSEKTKRLLLEQEGRERDEALRKSIASTGAL